MKAEKIDVEKPPDLRLVASCVDKIVSYYSHMTPRIKIVVGMKLFKRKQADIKIMVEQSSHIRFDAFHILFRILSPILDLFREEDAFLAKMFDIQATPKFDKYADAFAMLEKGKF